MREEVFLEVVDEGDGLAEELLRPTAVHQDGFGSEHLRHLGEDAGSALRHKPIAELAYEGVGGDARETVAASALQAHAELCHRHILAFVLGSLPAEFAQLAKSFLHLVALYALRHEQANALLVVVAQHGHEVFGLVVFASQREHQHTARIGVEHDVAQYLARVLVVVRELRAAVVVVPGMQGLAAQHAAFCAFFGQFLLHELDDALGHSVDASHRRHYPHLVSDAHFAVPSHVALEGKVLLRNAKFFVHRVILVGERARKVSLQVVLVHPLARLQVDGGVAYRIAIFQDVLAGGCVDEQNLMSGGHVLTEHSLQTVYFDAFASLHGAKGHYHAVGGVDAYVT